MRTVRCRCQAGFPEGLGPPVCGEFAQGCPPLTGAEPYGTGFCDLLATRKGLSPDYLDASHLRQIARPIPADRKMRGRFRSTKERLLLNKFLSCAAVLGLLVASSSSVLAGGRGGGASQFTPAFASQNPSQSALKPVTGFSGPAAYAPGHQFRDPTSIGGNTSAPGNGAAVYAPGFLK